jgi:hypothetical protein
MLRRYRHILILLTILISLNPSAVGALENLHTFARDSIILPADSCWQPNNDPAIVSSPLNSVCDTDVDDRSLFQLYGLLYALLDVGDDPQNCRNDDGTIPQQPEIFGYCKQIPVYWVIDRSKTDPQQPDLVIQGSSAPLVTVFNSDALTSVGDANNPIYYTGGPFIIDANKLTDAEIQKIKDAVLTKFPAVKMHIAQVEFAANVDKVLIGKPPKVAVLNEGASEVLEDYIRASGLFSWQGNVFQYVSALDVIDGCLQDPVSANCSVTSRPFQLIWAPHWEIEKNWGAGYTPSPSDQTTVVSEIRDFLERGNAGFFECASIESLEGSSDTGQDVDSSVAGYLIGSDRQWYRIDKNQGCSDQGNCQADYLVYEEPPFWLMQCGGWRYEATGGHVHNMRPRFDTSYTWLTTKTEDDPSTSYDDRYLGPTGGSSGRLLTRFIHDNPAKLNNTYDPGATDYYVYDYLVGGRINASPTQGYVVYFPGHKYIKCQNDTIYEGLPARTIDIHFDSDPPADSTIWVEVVHQYCTQGVDCPKVSFDIASQHGTIIQDNWIELSSELAEYDSSDHALEGVYFVTKFSEDVATDLLINDIIITFDNNLGTVSLTNVVDVTEKLSLCAPYSSASPVSCANPSYHPEEAISLHFSGDIMAGTNPANPADPINIVTVQINNGPSAQYNLITGVGTVGDDGNVRIDMTSAVYDQASYALRNIKLTNLQCQEYDINDIYVTFPDNGDTINLDLIYNDTVSEGICDPGVPSVASCSSESGPPPAPSEVSINAKLEFKSEYRNNDADIRLEITYDCGQGCSGTLSATYDVSENSGTTSEDTNFRIDMSSANWDRDHKKLQNIVLTNKDGSKQLIITHVKVWFERRRKLKKLKDTTNNRDIASWGGGTDHSPADKDTHYIIEEEQQQGGGGQQTLTVYETLKPGICDYHMSPYLSTCDIDWNSSNTCGIKYVLNTLLALKFQITSSEFTKTQPIVKKLSETDYTYLYKASYDYPIYRGHLKKIRMPEAEGELPEEVWDAQDVIPPAGTTGNPTIPSKNNSTRYIFTYFDTNGDDIPDKVDFDTDNTSLLMGPLGASDETSAQVIINSVRGRKDAAVADPPGPFGTGEATHRLWAIEHSTPVLMTDSRLVDPVDEGSVATGGYRDIVVFVGADDGMLHAFHAGSYDTNSGEYDVGTGKEIWAYIPSNLLGSLGEQPFNVKYNPDNPTDYSIFEPKVSVDGSPAIGDFLVNIGTEASPAYEWHTLLIGTAEIRNTANEDHSKGILFTMDVSNPYAPELLWENKYYDTDSSKKCLGDEKNCNMGHSKGAAIGSVFFGGELKSVAFVTAIWANKQKATINLSNEEYNHDYCYVDAETEGTCSDPQYTNRTDCLANGGTWTPDTPPADCVFGIGVYAIDLMTGQVIWDTKLPYTGDAINIAETAAIPALMDIDDNGTADYVVFGDVQGRLWALNTVNGKSIRGEDETTHNPLPVFEVPSGYSCDQDTSRCQITDWTPAGPMEPIGAAVSVKGNTVVFGTGGSDSDFAPNDKRYHIFVLRILTSPYNGKYYKVMYVYQTEVGEKIWAKPLITADMNVFVASARNYYTREENPDVSQLQSEGRIGVIELSTGNITIIKGQSDEEWLEGGVVGGFDAEAKHAYVVTLKSPSANTEGIYQIGGEEFTLTLSTDNPYNILWWRKL